MFIADLFESYVAEAGPQLVVLYPGRFQPFHLGHGEVFRSLQSKFGRDSVYIATSNKVELPKSPFNFSDKSTLMHAAGIPSDRILEVVSPYKLPEPQFNPANSIFIVAVGAPDRERLRPDSVKKDGTPGYFKTFESLDKCTTADKHGYVIIADERQKVITINGQQVDVSHGTPARAVWNDVRDNPKLRSEYLMQMYGRDDPELGRVLDKIPQTVNEDWKDDYSPEQLRAGELAYKLDRHDQYNTGKYPKNQDNVVRQTGERPWDTKTVDMPGDFKSNTQKTALGDKIVNDPYKPNDMGNPWDWVDSEALTNYRRKNRFYEEAAGVGVVKDGNDPRYSMATMGDDNDVTAATLPRMMAGYHLNKKYKKLKEEIDTLKEKWSAKYKRSINCNNPKGFSQRAHCQGRKK